MKKIKKKSITELEKSQEALKKSEQRFRRLVEASSQIIWVADAKGNIKEDSRSWRVFTGRTYDQLADWNWIKTIHPDDREQLEKAWLKSIKTATICHVEFRQLNADGQYRNIVGTAVPILDEKGRILEWIGINQDVTKRKEAEVAILEKDELMKKAQEIARLGSWELDLKTNRLSWSDEVYRIFGLKPQEFEATYEAFLKMIHPDDRAAVDAAYSNSLRDKKDCYDIEHRVVRKSDGEIRTVHEKCEHIRDKSGRVIRSIGMVHDITKLKKSEEALRLEKEFSENILRTMPDGLDIIDENHEILYTNKTLMNEFGKNNIGKKCYEVYRIDKKQCGNCPLKNSLNGEVKNLEVPGIKNNKTFLVSHTSIMMNGKKCVLEIFSDITERKKMEEQLAISNRALQEALIRVRALFANIGEGVIATDKNGKIIALNKMAEVISGFKTNNLLGKSLFSMFRLEDQQGQLISKSLHPVNLALESNQVIRGTYLLKKDSLNPLPLFITSSPVALKGETIEGVTIFRDISEQMAIDKAKDEFVFTVSHELRTPLSAMSWIIERVFEEKDQMSEKLKKYLGDTYSQTQRMLELVNNLLNATRMELGVFSYKYEDINLKDIVTEIASEFENKINDKKIVFKSAISKDTNMRKIYPSAIPIILRNLMSNAIKFTPVGGKINLKISKIENQLVIAVTDSGIGIPRQDLAKIFQKTYRAQNVKGKFDGSGLGLYIIKGIIDHMGGKIVVKSRKIKGTTFTIILPLGGIHN